jgi:hypothetical protein
MKKIFGGNFDRMVLERLDRLTLDEGRRNASQILKVVYGLVQNMRVVMDGEQTGLDSRAGLEKSLDGKSSIDSIWDSPSILDGKSFIDSIWDSLSMFASASEFISVSNSTLEVMQHIVINVNKSKRQ